MTTKTVYRSTAAEVRAVCDRNHAAAADAAQRRDQLLAKWLDAGFGVLTRRDALESRPVGIRHTEDRRQPEGRWRWSSTAECWVPDKRYAAGKELARVFGSLRVEFKWVPGMPRVHVVDERWCTPGMFWDDDAVWVTWPCSHELIVARGETWGGPKLNESLWERGKLSEFHAAMEKAEETREEVPA
jgi:hypothetical protein